MSYELLDLLFRRVKRSLIVEAFIPVDLHILKPSCLGLGDLRSFYHLASSLGSFAVSAERGL